MSVMNGFRFEMLRLVGISGARLREAGRLDARPSFGDLRRCPALSATPRRGPGSRGGDSEGVVLRGVQAEDFKARAPLSAAI